MNKRKVYEKLPKGWAITKGTLTEPNGYVWISNQKSRFSPGRKSGLLKL